MHVDTVVYVNARSYNFRSGDYSIDDCVHGMIWASKVDILFMFSELAEFWF
jgi:hypothetical protein